MREVSSCPELACTMHAETNALVRETACPEREVSSTIDCALPDTTGRGAVRVLESHKIKSRQPVEGL